MSPQGRRGNLKPRNSLGKQIGGPVGNMESPSFPSLCGSPSGFRSPGCHSLILGSLVAISAMTGDGSLCLPVLIILLAG